LAVSIDYFLEWLLCFYLLDVKNRFDKIYVDK
jgi:hypothetical protein